MLTQEDPEHVTKSAIETFVANHWEAYKNVCFLSNLGGHLKAHVPESKSALSDGLIEFLRQNKIVQVIKYPGIAEKIGAVPLSVALPKDITTLFKRNTELSIHSKYPSYSQDFWYAFINPIECDCRSVLVGNDGVVSIREGLADESGSTTYQILAVDLTTGVEGETTSKKAEQTHSKISDWLSKNSLDPDIFLRRTKRKSLDYHSSRLMQFLDVFEDFSQEDLARIDVPLDILVKLRSKR